MHQVTSGNRNRIPVSFFSFPDSTPGSVLYGISDRLETPEQVRERVTYGLISFTARQTRVQILTLPVLNYTTLASY